jgi:secondary thiamine-phosphate synthase enzyme
VVIIYKRKELNKREVYFMVKELSIITNKNVEMQDVTSKIRSLIKESGIKEGICTVFIPHTTAGVTINENADPEVVRDFTMEINKIVPFEDNYKHMEGNSAAHIKASIMGASETIIVHNGELLLGIWQGIYFCEYDGPRTRKMVVKICEC